VSAAAAAGPAADRCPRCGGGFHCGRDDSGPCACSGVRLDAATLAALRSRYAGCLCLRCLQAIAKAAPVGGPALTAGQGS
jgi:hypothetical protein